MDYFPGEIINKKYRVIAKLGSGATGTVYKAEHCLIHQLVAIKVLHPENCASEEQVIRFKREAEAAASISHENICRVIDFASTPKGELILVMEYLEGESLAGYLSRKKILPPNNAFLILNQLLSALSCAHKAGIVHRDIKPDNILLINGRDDFLKLVDFGIARKMTDDKNKRLTRAGFVYGTPQYLSPEQATGTLYIDHRCDLYSVGIIMFEMLTGTLPFQDVSVMNLLNKHITEPPPQIYDRNPDLEGLEELNDVVQKLLSKDPAMRYQSADEVKEALASETILTKVPKRVKKVSKSASIQQFIIDFKMGRKKAKQQVLFGFIIFLSIALTCFIIIFLTSYYSNTQSSNVSIGTVCQNDDAQCRNFIDIIQTKVKQGDWDNAFSSIQYIYNPEEGINRLKGNPELENTVKNLYKKIYIQYYLNKAEIANALNAYSEVMEYYEKIQRLDYNNEAALRGIQEIREKKMIMDENRNL